MYGGKYIGYFFPNWNWGSHFVVNREAFKLLTRETSEDHRIKLKKQFPTLKTINLFEDLNGPDGLWLEGKWKSSSMHYNPVNGQGEAPQGIRNNFIILQKILSRKKKTLIRIRSARRAAYLSHLVVDSLTPTHHYGRNANQKIRYYWWLIKSDWKEEGISGLKKGVSLEYWHKEFEFKTFFKMLGNNFGPVKIHYDFIKKYQAQQKENPFILQNNAIDQIEKIFKLNIYRTFIKNRWSDSIQETMLKQVFPEMISWVATYWLLAIYEANDIKY